VNAVDWSRYTDEEVVASCKSAPRIFGPWQEWHPLYGGNGYAWSRHEVFPGPCWKSGGTVSVLLCTGCPGYHLTTGAIGGAIWFETADAAKAVGDAWLLASGCRLEAALGEP